MLRTHTAGSLGTEQIGQTVTLSGWVDRRRDHGGVAFIDLRDASGVANVVLAVCPDEGGGGLVGRAEDASGGEWSVASVGRRIVHKETVDGVVTRTAADARAAELLRTSQAVVRRLTVRHVYAPVAVGDSVDVSYGDASGRFAVRAQRLTLAHGCLTESELRAYER